MTHKNINAIEKFKNLLKASQVKCKKRIYKEKKRWDPLQRTYFAFLFSKLALPRKYCGSKYETFSKDSHGSDIFLKINNINGGDVPHSIHFDCIVKAFSEFYKKFGHSKTIEISKADFLNACGYSSKGMATYILSSGGRVFKVLNDISNCRFSFKYRTKNGFIKGENISLFNDMQVSSKKITFFLNKDAFDLIFKFCNVIDHSIFSDIVKNVKGVNVLRMYLKFNYRLGLLDSCKRGMMRIKVRDFFLDLNGYQKFNLANEEERRLLNSKAAYYALKLKSLKDYFTGYFSNLTDQLLSENGHVFKFLEDKKIVFNLTQVFSKWKVFVNGKLRHVKFLELSFGYQ